MRWEYDADAGSLYVSLAEGQAHHQDEMPDGLIVDVDADGRPIGIEVLSAWAPFNFRDVARRYDLGENDIASLDFLVVTIAGHIHARPTEALVQSEFGTTSLTPARVLTNA